MSEEIDIETEATATYVAYALPQQFPRAGPTPVVVPRPRPTDADWTRIRHEDYSIEEIVDQAHDLFNICREPRADASWPHLREKLEWADCVLKSRDGLRARFLLNKVRYFLGHAPHPSHQSEASHGCP